MTTTWQILDTKRRISDGLIIEVMYGCIARAGGEIDRKIGTVELTGDSTSPDFKPFNTLTEEIIITWVKDLLGDTEVTNIENTLKNTVQTRIADKEAQTEKNGLPWI